jgi:hypothetical protein
VPAKRTISVRLYNDSGSVSTVAGFKSARRARRLIKQLRELLNAHRLVAHA